MAKKKATKKKPAKKAAKKSKGKKKAVCDTPLKERDDIAAKKKARLSFEEVLAEEEFQSFTSDAAQMEVQRYPRIFTGLVEVDLLFCPTIGSCIELNGDQSQGKSTLSYIMAGSLLRTCRLCNTLSVEWVDEETGEVVETCRCGKNRLMTGVIADIERSCDPIWMDIWGCRLGTGFEEKTQKTGGFKVLVPKGRKANLHIVRPRAGGALYTFLQRVLETGAKDFVVIDSMNSVISDEALGKAAGQRNVADRARMNWDGLRRLAAAQLETSNQWGTHPTVIWTNHRIMDISAKRPRKIEAGGGGPKIFADQRIQFTYTKKNAGKGDLPFTAFIDTHFGVSKNKAGLPDGGKGTFRLYTNSVSMNRIPFYPGDTDDAEKVYTVLQDLGLFEEKKSKYIVLGRTFKKVSDVKAFLSREDIKMECRFWLGVFMMSTTARAHLRFEDYCYSPFESARRYYEQTFEEVEKKVPGLCLGVALGDEPENYRAIEEARRQSARKEAEEEAASLTDDLLEEE